MPKRIVYVCRDCSYIYDSDPGECPQCLGIIQEMEMLPRAAHLPNGDGLDIPKVCNWVHEAFASAPKYYEYCPMCGQRLSS